MTEKLRQLEARGLVNALQVRAGVAFEADYRAALTDVSHRSMMRERNRGPADACDHRAVQRARYHKACLHLGELRWIVIAVVCEGRAAREWTDEAGEKPDAAMPLLRLGLSALARFYSLAEAA